jgi:hypothetical protein
MTDQPRKRITIDVPSEMTILAARHLDATEGPVQIGSTVDTATRSAITTVLRYIATAHNAEPVSDEAATEDEMDSLVGDALAALGRADAEVIGLRNRLRLAHQARRAKEHQLDDIRRALCDTGLMTDDDPYSHADLADVIRQTANSDRERAVQAEELQRIAHDTSNKSEAEHARAQQRAEQAEAALERVRKAVHIADTADATGWQRGYRACSVNALRALDETASGPAATEPTVDRQTAVVLAALHHSAETAMSRVINLHERWVKAGPPPLGTSLARWWDKRLIELHDAILNPTKEQP